ncbi:MAG: hypothetical protein JWR69_3590 [Pedosphaera sp.]|nr:hypothetical protein [Pedosphaera sp.]
MNSRFNPVRWLKIVMLGCILGLLFVFWRVSLIVPRDGNERSRARMSKLAPMPQGRLSDEAVRKELIEVIQSQLSAFRKHDYSKAYKYAASDIQSQVSLPAFERMVREGFPLLVRSSAVEFGVILDNGSQALVNVSLLSDSGRLIHYQYSLRRERAGWRITGVVRKPFEGTFV